MRSFYVVSDTACENTFRTFLWTPRSYFSRTVKRRIAKYLAIAALVVVILLAMGGWFVNRWLQSPEGHASVEKMLSDALKMPVKIESPGFSAWSGLSTKKITAGGPHGVVFEAAGMSASHSFFALLGFKLALGEVRIHQPHVRMFQDVAGKWGNQRGAAMPLLTSAPPEAEAQPMAGAPLPFRPAGAPAPAPVEAPPVALPPAAASTSKPPAFSVGKVFLENGTFEMFDKAGAPFATVTGLNVTMRDVTGTAFTGRMTIARAVFHGKAAIEAISGDTARNGQVFTLSNLTAMTGGGVVTGEANYTLGATAAATLRLVAVNLDLVTQDGGMKGQKISGIVSGDAQFAGIGADKRLLTGKGTLSLKGGDCSQFDLLRQIGEVLRVTMLAKFQIADAAANFQVANEQVTLAPMEISTPPVGLAFSGPIAFDGTLNLTAFLSAPADMVAAQPVIAGNFSPPDAKNRRSVTFHITGPMTKPRQDLADAITGTKNHREQNIIGATSVISSILGRNSPKLMKKLAPMLDLVKPALEKAIPGKEPAPEQR